MDRLVQWKQTPVSVKSVPFEGGPVQHGDNCDSSYAYVYAGHGVTDGNGVWHIRLSDVTCDTPGPRHGSIPSVVATPTYGFLDQKPRSSRRRHPRFSSPSSPPTPSPSTASVRRGNRCPPCPSRGIASWKGSWWDKRRAEHGGKNARPLQKRPCGVVLRYPNRYIQGHIHVFSSAHHPEC
jgi:hypothetical protein